jgi:hypothetical protein
MVATPSAPSELVSGPDLGGGYLHQLSIDRAGGTTSFTHHAQDGGDDAGGPPIGELGPLGFVHPSAACMFGGPRCWHRRYLLPFSATPRVRAAYQRHRFVLDRMLRQLAGEAPIGVDDALREVIRRVAAPLAAEGIPWYVAGSTSVRLLAGAGAPRDIDLGTTRAGIDRLGELLADYLVEPVGPTDWPGGRLVVGGRAFVGSPRSGARVEWAVPLGPREAGRWEEFAPVAGVTRTAPARFDAADLLVSRPEYALVRAAEKDRPASVDAAVAAVERLGVDRELLELLLARSRLSGAGRAAVRARVPG